MEELVHPLSCFYGGRIRLIKWKKPSCNHHRSNLPFLELLVT